MIGKLLMSPEAVNVNLALQILSGFSEDEQVLEFRKIFDELTTGSFIEGTTPQHLGIFERSLNINRQVSLRGVEYFDGAIKWGCVLIFSPYNFQIISVFTDRVKFNFDEDNGRVEKTFYFNNIKGISTYLERFMTSYYGKN